MSSIDATRALHLIPRARAAPRASEPVRSGLVWLAAMLAKGIVCTVISLFDRAPACTNGALGLVDARHRQM
jgi:hypothetical protein